jgi:20S proteasome subunit alpha 7
VELEKLKLSELTCREALSSIAKIIYSVHDDVKDKEFELELRYVKTILRIYFAMPILTPILTSIVPFSWICEESGWKHQKVPEALRVKAAEDAKAALEEAGDD